MNEEILERLADAIRRKATERAKFDAAEEGNALSQIAKSGPGAKEDYVMKRVDTIIEQILTAEEY